MIVVDWGSEHPAWKASSYPRHLIREINREVGRHPLVDWYQGGLESKEDYKNIADKLITGVELRTRALQYMLGKDEFDFVFCNYSEPNWAGHIFWHLHDKDHPEYAPEHAAYCGDVVQQTYQACDHMIGELISTFDGANVVVMSNIGMGTHAGGDMMVSEILRRLGMSAQQTSSSPVTSLIKVLVGDSGPIAAIQRVEELISPAMITRIKKVFPERLWDTWTRRLLSMGNNWGESRAFHLPGDNSSLIRINLHGREPRGRVMPGDEYKQLCLELADAFMELLNAETGEPAVEKVVILREHLQGDQIDQLPDLAVVWNNFRVPIEALTSPRIGRVEIPVFNKRSGGHLHEGFLVGAGPSFRNGVALERHDLEDVAPTLLALFGLPAPDYMDGNPIMALLKIGPIA